MNKVFRVIWSEAQGAWVAVSETTKSHSKRSRKAALALALAAGGLLGVTGYASATSTGEIGPGSIAIGPAAGPCALTDAKGESSISIGCEAGGSAVGNNQTNLGFQAGADSDGDFNTALGSNTGESVKGKNNTAVGLSSGGLVKGDNNAAVGYSAGRNVTGDDNAAIGNNAGTGVVGDRNLSFGSKAGRGVEGFDNAAFGSNAGENVTGKRNTGFGNSAGKGVQGESNTSLGDSAGRSLRGDGNLSAGLVAGQNTFGDHNVMLGNKASTVGSKAGATISRTVVIGSEAEAYFDDTVALGSNAKAGHENSVALGHASQTAAAAQVKSAVINTEVDGKTGTFTYSGFEGTASGVVSVGSAGAERQIINVAPGAITDKSTDAINGSQLFSVAKGINTDMYIQGNSVAQALGGGSKYEGGKVTADLTVGGNSYTNVQDALNNISTAGGWTLGSKDDTGAAQDLAVDAGGKVNLNAGKNMQVISEQDTSGEITTTFATNDDVDFDSVTTAGAVMNADGISVAYDDGTGTIVTGPSMTKAGISAGNLKITNVQAGTADADGVNVSQLKGLGSVIGGVKIDNTTGAMTGPTFTVNQNGYKTINEAIAELDKGWTLSDGNAGTTQVQAGDTAVIKAGDNMDVTIDATGEMIVKTKDEVTFTQVTTGDSVLNKDGLQVGADVFVTNQGLQAGNTFITNNGLTFKNSTVAVTAAGINAGGQKITNVAAGTESTDGVNFGQLESVKNTAEQGWNVSVNGGTAEQVKPGATVDFKAGNNIQISQNGTEIKIETTPDVEHNKVTTGQSSLDNDGLKVGADVAVTDTGLTAGQTTVDNNGLQVGADVAVTDTGLKAGGTSVTDAGLTFDGSSVAVNKGGINAGGNKITNVAAGTELTDGVNFGQLESVKNTAEQGWNVSVNGGTAEQVKPGATVDFEAGNNIQISQNGTEIKIETTPDVEHNKVTTGQSSLDNDGLKVGADVAVTDTGLKAGGTSVTDAGLTFDGSSVVVNKDGINAGGNKITSVAKGDISENSTDAINGSQLNEINNRVTKNEYDIKNIQNIQNGKDGMFQVSEDYNATAPKPTGTKSAAGGAGAEASGENSTAIGNDAKATASNSTALGNSALASANNSVALGQGSVADRANSVSVGTVGGERQITNVAAGVAPTDAVNVSQLEALGGTVNQYFNAANKRIDKVDNNARAGIAAAMAAGTLPQSTLPGKSMVTVGASTYRGESALAIGVSRLSDNARTVIKANASADSRGNAGAAVGAGWHW